MVSQSKEITTYVTIFMLKCIVNYFDRWFSNFTCGIVVRRVETTTDRHFTASLSLKTDYAYQKLSMKFKHHNPNIVNSADMLLKPRPKFSVALVCNLNTSLNCHWNTERVYKAFANMHKMDSSICILDCRKCCSL